MTRVLQRSEIASGFFFICHTVQYAGASFIRVHWCKLEKACNYVGKAGARHEVGGDQAAVWRGR
jgi:hypothetical protein